MGVNNPDSYMSDDCNFTIEYYENGQIKCINGKRLEYNGKIPVIADYLREHQDREDRVRS